MDEPTAFTEEEARLLDRIAEEVVRRRLEVPAIFLLESMKPLSFVGAQAMHFFQPIVAAFLPPDGWDRLASLLERRETLEALIRRIEAKVE
ncbi:MAG: hypothetical protein D6729_05695 [Deltaproteobacteria bacterium]|nr:MAG: hypothetical protein D6729_05695 [Deltaproteobacteria bacterium]